MLIDLILNIFYRLRMNKYSPYKIFNFSDKLQAIKSNTVTSPICVRIKPFNGCPHKCGFCVYNPEFAGMHELCNRTDMIPIGKMLEILNDLHDMGVKSIILSGGGEPLMHPQIKRILDRICEHGFEWAVITNGQQILKHVEYLQYAKWVRVSSDYWDGDSFAKSRGLQNKKLNEILDGIHVLSETKCEVGINYIISEESYLGIFEAAAMFFAEGASNIRYCPVWLDNLQEYHKDIEWLTKQEIDRAIKMFDNHDFRVYDGYNLDFKDRRDYDSCVWQQIVPVIAADQMVYRCHNTSYTPHGRIGSIQNRRFKDVWFSEDAKKNMLSFAPSLSCNHQCSNENRNRLLNYFLDSSNDSFV